MKKKLTSLLVITLTLLLGFGLASCNNKATQEKVDLSPEVVVLNTEASNKEYSSLVEMLEDVRPSVVDITSYGKSFTSKGSGVIIGSSDANKYYIVTNHHVIDEASSFEVVVYEDTNQTQDTYEASLIGGSPSNDIAVLSIETQKQLKVSSFLEDSSSVKVGTEVVAIGNPLGILGGTVTKGIISATAREVYISGIGYMQLFQTDAAINSGNSGGALFNTQGQLVGIVNSGYTDYEGLNFAIPGNAVKAAVKSLIDTYHNQTDNYGYVEGESNLGLTLDDISQIYSDSSLQTQVSVVYVSETTSIGDAKKAGIKDYAHFKTGNTNTFFVITKINGTSISSSEEATKILQKIPSGETVTFSYKEVEYKRASQGMFGTSYFYYLGDTEKEVAVTVSQFIYSIPNE